jgi:hypothetical protein
LKGKILDFLKSNCTRLLASAKRMTSWIALILEENDLARFNIEDVLEPIDVTAKEKHQKDIVRAKRIIADYIKDHLIPQVASKKTPKEMFDALTRLYEGMLMFMPLL